MQIAKYAFLLFIISNQMKFRAGLEHNHSKIVCCMTINAKIKQMQIRGCDQIRLLLGPRSPLVCVWVLVGPWSQSGHLDTGHWLQTVGWMWIVSTLTNLSLPRQNLF